MAYSLQPGYKEHSDIPSLGNSLTLRSNRFIDHWLKTGNGTESARIAGFPGDDNALASAASRLLRSAKVTEEINRRLGKHIASSEEVLVGLTNHARADLADILESDGSFNLSSAKRRGMSKLLKKLKVKTRYETDSKGKVTPVTEHEFEVYDAQAAMVHLGKVHGLFDSPEEDKSLSLGDIERAARLADALATIGESRKRLNSDSTQVIEAKGEAKGELTE